MPAYNNVCIPYHETADISFVASAAVTGKRFLAISADRTGGPALSTDTRNLPRCAHAAAGTRAIGVAKYDVANGDVGGLIGTPGRVVPITAGAGITAGQELEVGTNGQAIPRATGIAVAIALNTVTSGNDVQAKLL